MEISKALKEFYFSNKTTLSKDDKLTIGQIFSDALIGFGADYIANYLVEKSDVYFYQFGFPGKYSVSDIYRQDGDPASNFVLIIIISSFFITFYK